MRPIFVVHRRLVITLGSKCTELVSTLGTDSEWKGKLKEVESRTSHNPEKMGQTMRRHRHRIPIPMSPQTTQTTSGSFLQSQQTVAVKETRGHTQPTIGSAPGSSGSGKMLKATAPLPTKTTKTAAIRLCLLSGSSGLPSPPWVDCAFPNYPSACGAVSALPGHLASLVVRRRRVSNRAARLFASSAAMQARRPSSVPITLSLKQRRLAGTRSVVQRRSSHAHLPPCRA